MEQIRIIREMRQHDADSGRTGQFLRPRYMVWENVPGAFSSNKGNDFAAVLEETIRIAEPEAPSIEVPEKGWPTWGGYRDVDGRWSVAWRVLDAQYWGVPQRRRRIAFVADFGGCTAHEILFEHSSVYGHPAQSGATGERTSGVVESNADDASGTGIGCNTPWETQTNRQDERSPTLNAECGGNKPAIVYSFDSLASNSMKFSNPHSGCREVDVSKTLDTTIPEPSKNQGGIAILDMSHATDVIRECGDTVPTLQSRMGTGGNQVPLTYAWRRSDQLTESDVACTQSARQYKSATDLICAVDCRNGTENSDVNGTLQAKSNGGFNYNSQNVVRENMIVRRLTPLECERLQGFPDFWTDIGAWRDEKWKLHKESSDAARYKAIGNSIAIPPWKWVLKRICAQYERDATMGSLFDGLGGFPLIWTQLNGWNSVKWASEIEPFCIAVTKRHFGDEETGERGDMWEYLIGEKDETEVKHDIT